MEVLKNKIYKARKQHQCDNGHPIEPGESYNYKFAIDNGLPEVFKMCADCHMAFCSLYVWESNDDIDFGLAINPSGKRGVVVDDGDAYAAQSDGTIFERRDGKWIEVEE